MAKASATQSHQFVAGSRLGDEVIRIFICFPRMNATLFVPLFIPSFFFEP